MDSTFDRGLAQILGDDVTERLITWQHEHGRKISLDKELTAGYTDAVVFTAYVDCDGSGVRKVVVKVIPAAETEGEPGRHDAALHNSPPHYVNLHLVKQAFPSLISVSGAEVMFQDIAGGSITSMVSMASFTGMADLATIAGSVSKGVIEDWNPNPTSKSLTVSEFMKMHVGSKLGEGGSLYSWGHDKLGASLMAAPVWTFEADERASKLINPLLLRDHASKFGSREFITILGHAHGDLHLENVLINVKRTGPDDTYRLIDLSYYANESPLTRDPANLLISELERTLPTLLHSAKRALLAVVVGDREESLTADIVGLDRTVSAILRASDAHFLSRGLNDEWHRQQLLSLAGQSLVAAGRSRLSSPDRIWFLELAARAATRWVGESGYELPQVGAASVGETIDEKTRAAIGVVEEISRACNSFESPVTTVCILADSCMQASSVALLARAGWNVIVDFDPQSAESGAYLAAQKLGEAPKLLIPTQLADFSHRATTWIAANGLTDPETLPEVLSLREWRTRYFRGLSQQIESLVTAFSGPICAVIFGAMEQQQRSVLESFLDRSGDRLRILSVGNEIDEFAMGYGGEQHYADPDLVARGFLPQATGSRSDGAVHTVPGNKPGEQVAIDDIDSTWIQEECELLHSHIGLQADSVYGVGEDFYSGRRITWFELSNDVDIPRHASRGALAAALDTLLGDRGTRRHTFRHRPGSGGTTLIRRVAWQLHRDHPVMMATRVTSSRKLRSRIVKLAQITKRQILVVIENTSESITNDLYDLLKADSTPVVLLLVSRRTTREVASLESPNLSKELGELGQEEREDFVRIFAALSPIRRPELKRIGGSRSSTAVPFIYALTAFQKNFTGLQTYVETFLDSPDPQVRDVVIMISLIHRYAGVPVPANAFAVHLGLPANSPSRFAGKLDVFTDGLILEEPPGSWRSTHTLIASELLKQALTPDNFQTLEQDTWKSFLASWCVLIIHTLSDSFPDDIPTEITQVLELLFVTRDNRENSDAGRSKFSELMESIPTFSGRSEVMAELVASFPEHSIFWQHYARQLGLGGKDYPAAREAIMKALELADGDPQLWHTKGVLVRAELYNLLQNARADHSISSNEVESAAIVLVREALGDFSKSEQLRNDNDYPPLSSAEMCIFVLEWAKSNSDHRSYADFLTQPSSAFYSDLLSVAEDSLAKVEEIAGDSAPSQMTKRAHARLEGIYDNYSGMLQGWRNILDQTTGSKLDIRVRLARLYGKRNESWEKARQDDINRAIQLLNENLLDTPGEPRTMRLWIRAARRAEVSLDRAAEVVSFWTESDPQSRDAHFYSCSISALLALEGRQTAVRDFERKLQSMRSATASFPQRRAIYEWLGHGDGLSQLVHSSCLDNWDRKGADSPEPDILRRLTGRVVRISGPTSGQIHFTNGIEAHFVPSVTGLVANRDENMKVSALVGFSYDGLRAWGVRRVQHAQ